MADPDVNEAPAQINAYLIKRVKTLESMVEDLGQRNAELLAWMMEHHDHYAEISEEAASYFALIERNRT